MPRLVEIEAGAGRVILVVTAHADDAALFLGGTVALWTRAGWHVVVVRVTDDRWDSVELNEADTVAANAHEFRAAMAVLGVAEVVDLGWPTDTLGDASEVTLREQMIRLVRTHRPHTLVTFDPYSGVGEDNQDHVKVAQAVDESFWTSQFDKHHPEHLVAGLAPHGVAERWYFGRPVREVTDVVDVTSTADLKVQAALAHRTPLRNLVQQLRLQARTGGWRVPLLDEVFAAGPDADLAPVVGPLLRQGVARVGATYGVAAAEEFRVVRLGGLGSWFAEHGVPIDGGGGSC